MIYATKETVSDGSMLIGYYLDKNPALATGRKFSEIIETEVIIDGQYYIVKEAGRGCMSDYDNPNWMNGCWMKVVKKSLPE